VCLNSRTSTLAANTITSGQQWWQAAQYVTPLGGLPLRPHGFSFNANNTIIRYMKISQPIAWNFALKGNNYVVHDNWIDASYDLNTPAVFPFNTDGYDVGGYNYTFYNNHVFNGDDCVAVNNGGLLCLLFTARSFL
jgi:hypothetical protein